MQRVDNLARRLVHPAAKLRQQARDAEVLAGRLVRALRHRLGASAIGLGGLAQRLAWRLRQPLPQAARLAALGQNLAHLNPKAVLDRGYAIVTTVEGMIVQDGAQIAVGDDVALAFARGGAGAKVTTVRR
jgi:exodeoxyribonuclease VII large subunit